MKKISFQNFLIVSPFFVLVVTKIFIEFCTSLFIPSISWIPAFLGYYLAIIMVLLLAKRYYSFSILQIVPSSFKPIPKSRLLFWGIIFPALLPLTAFFTQISYVSLELLLYIVIFSLINPLFEEGFWRGLLFHLPGSKTFCICYSASLFSFSHIFLWRYWFKIRMIIIPTVISTLIMGVLWMWFMKSNRNIIYPILSHVLVDIFNLSVAVYCGLIPMRLNQLFAAH